MNITSRNGHLSITGNVKSVEHYKTLKNELDKLIGISSSLVIEFVDSISLTSSVIGQLVHTVKQHGVDIEMRVHNSELYELLEDLGLDQVMRIEKVS